MIQELKPFVFKENAKEDFGMDTSLTSLNWLQKLNCRTGLTEALQTPSIAPAPRLSMHLSTGVGKAPQNLLDRLPSVKELDEAVRREHAVDATTDWSAASEPKPPHNYATLIYMAVRQTPTAKVTLNDVYQYIQTRFMWYRVATPGWKNSIRHNLTQNKFFKKTMRPDSEEGPCKGGFWTLDINLQNIDQFSCGIWRQSKVKQKPAQKAGSKKTAKGPKSGKPTKGNSKVGKSSPKNGRRKSSTSSVGSMGSSLNSPTSALAKMSLSQQTKADRDLPSEMMSGSWSLFGGDDDVFQDVKLFDIYTGADAAMITCDEELENALVESPGGSGSGYDSPASAAITVSPSKPIHSRAGPMTPMTPMKNLMTTASITSGVNGCFDLSDGLARLGSGISPAETFDDLVTDFKTAGSLGGINLQVVGVGMSLHHLDEGSAPLPLTAASNDPIGSPTRLSNIREERLQHLMDDLNYSAPIPLDWNL